MNKKITLNDFFEMNKKAAIHCDTKEKAEKLLLAFHNMGKRWNAGNSYLKNSYWDRYENDTAYGNDGQFGRAKDYKSDENVIFEFYDIIFKKENTMDRSNNNLIKSVTLNNKKKITTVVFADGDVKMVKCGENDAYSPEMGIVYCMALKYSGLSKTQFKKMIDGFISKEK